MDITTLRRHTSEALHSYELQKRASQNPWFNVPLNANILQQQILVEGFTADALTLAQLASRNQQDMLLYLNAAAYVAEALPVNESLMLQILKERAYDLKIVTIQYQPQLPWYLSLPLVEQNKRVQEFLDQVDPCWNTTLVYELGAAYLDGGKLLLSPLFNVLATMT